MPTSRRQKSVPPEGPAAPPPDLTSTTSSAVKSFWTVYYNQMRARHLASGLDIHTPLTNRNLSTTASKHVHVLERFWQLQLASVLNVPESEVGKRTVKFRPYRSKSFDVCWPLKGPPKILISVKSMQNAYRNLTNRIEEAFGDSAVLRIYNSNAAFGFFFFLLDGPVARGQAVQGVSPENLARLKDGKKSKGINPFLAEIHEGGDFFDLSKSDQYK
jgi:hypothetical protein